MPVKAVETKQVTFLSSLPGVWITMFRQPVTLEIDSQSLQTWGRLVALSGEVWVSDRAVCRVRPWGAEEQMESSVPDGLSDAEGL